MCYFSVLDFTKIFRHDRCMPTYHQVRTAVITGSAIHFLVLDRMENWEIYTTSKTQRIEILE